MATFKVTVQHKRSDGYYIVYIRLTHNRKVMFIKTDKMVNEKGVTKGSKEVKDTFVLNALIPTINTWVEKLNKVYCSTWTVDEVYRYISQNEDDICFSSFAREYINSLHDTLQPSTIKTYEFALNNLEKFAGTDKIMFRQLTSSFISSWIRSLSSSRASKFSYPISIKRIFNEGLKKFNDYDNDVIIIKNTPWVRISIPKIDKAEKKAITMEECRKFFSLVSSNEKVTLSIDVCKMVLCLAGINVADLYSLKKRDYYDGILHYERRKTRTRRDDHAYIEIKVPDMLLSTFGKYFSDANDEYLFNFHAKRSLESFRSFLRYYLGMICQEMLGMSPDSQYTPYTFRHTWATIAQNDLGASYEEIGFAMNHISTHKVTMGYVKPDFSRAWELNERVVEKIFFTNDKSKRLEEHHLPVFEQVREQFELRADAYFMGEVVAHVDGKGYHDTDEIISQLMDSIKDGVPDKCTIQIKVVNVTKNQTKYFERIRDTLNAQK